MGTIIDEYLEYLEAQGKSAATLRATRSDLSGFQRWWEQATRRSFKITQLVSRDIRRWHRERQQQDGVKPSTINRALSSLRGFCRWAMENGRHTNDRGFGSKRTKMYAKPQSDRSGRKPDDATSSPISKRNRP
jgi:site-specific recombinase XerD